MTKQTAVEWLFLMMNNPNKDQEFANKLLQKAKQMEKQQIIHSHLDGQSLVSCKDEYAEQYYNETFKNK
jgi:hypothetical protein